jgi:hypothetical protein
MAAPLNSHDVDAALEELYVSYAPAPSDMWMSLSAAAEIGIDVSQAPPASIVHLSAAGVVFEVIA